MASTLWDSRMTALESGALWGDLVLQWEAEDAAVPLEQKIQQKKEELEWAMAHKIAGRWRIAAELREMQKQKA